MKIDFVSDVVCPWCAIGFSGLERALEAIGEKDVTVNVQPFELNPRMGPEGEDLVAHLSHKYGIDAAQIAANGEAIRARGASGGFTFGPRTRIHNTFDAHRLLAWAATEGRQRELKRALLAAYFTDGEDPSDREVLANAAVAAGLDDAKARAVLASDDFAREVREREAYWQGLGIHAVPAVIVNDRHLIEGGQPPEVYERALRSLMTA